MWSHSQGESPKAMLQDKWTEIPRHTRHTCSGAAAEENVCVTLGQAQTLHLAWLKPLRRHSASPTQQWQAAGGSQKALHGVFLHPNNTSASEPRHLCSTAGLSGNEGSSKQVRYGAKHQTCTPCAVTGRICRKAGIISYSRCWIILLSETMVCFQGKQFQSPMVSLTLSPVPPLWVVLSTLPWHKWCPCAPSIPAVILEQDWGVPCPSPTALNNPIVIMSSFAQSCGLKTPDT